MPDGDTTIGATPGPDIDAVAATYSSRIGLVVQAQGPGWSMDPDPALASTRAFAPLPEFRDISFAPPTVFRFTCPVGEAIESCNSFLIIKTYCGGGLSLTPPAWYIYPALFPTIADLGGLVSIRELEGSYVEERTDDMYAFCYDSRGRSADAGDPISIFSLDKGGARFVMTDENWRFELQLPTADVYSDGANQFIAAHYPDTGKSTVRVLGGSVEIDPTAPGEPSMILSSGEQIVVTADGPGPVIELDQLYLPVTIK
ncbi:MAG: hypothetical protein R3C44_22560 [Chloroflexota bacterium]